MTTLHDNSSIHFLAEGNRLGWRYASHAKMRAPGGSRWTPAPLCLSRRLRGVSQYESPVQVNRRFRLVPGVRLAASVANKRARSETSRPEDVRVHDKAGRYVLSRRWAANGNYAHGPPPMSAAVFFCDGESRFFYAGRYAHLT